MATSDATTSLVAAPINVLKHSRKLSLIVPLKPWHTEQNSLRNSLAHDISFVLEIHGMTVLAQSANVMEATQYLTDEGELVTGHPRRCLYWLVSQPVTQVLQGTLRADLQLVFAEYLVDGASYDGHALAKDDTRWAEQNHLMNLARLRKGVAA